MTHDPRAQGGRAAALPLDGGARPGVCEHCGSLVRAQRAGAAEEPRGEGAAGNPPILTVRVPIRTAGGLNAREHWRVRAVRVRKEREATAWILNAIRPPILPLTVTLVRLGPSNGLDDDNLAGSCKGIRDEVARWLRLDDRDPRVTWRYAQRREKEWAVEVRFA